MTSLKPGDEAPRWVELCEMAKCSPDTPARAADAMTPAAWLYSRLREGGHEVALDEVKACWRAWRAHYALFIGSDGFVRAAPDDPETTQGRTA